MNESLEKRKNDFAKILEEKYAEKEVQWPWQNKNDAVKSTKVVAMESEMYDYQEEEIIVKNEFKFHLPELAICAIVAIVCFALGFKNPEASIYLYLFSGICFILFYYQYNAAIKERTFVQITYHGIQLENEPYIAWENVIASYIEDRSSSENTIYFLLLYHHNPIKDDFMVTRYEFENRGMDYKDICFYIEYWKTKNAIIN
jgi:hypothetical protein